MRSIPFIRLLVKLFWGSYRIEVVGEEHVAPLVESKTPFIPCYWHGQQFIGVNYMLRLQKTGLKTGFLVSPSRDGELAARLLSSLDVHVMRGSATRTGAQAMRQLLEAIVREKISPIMTPDGPKGPIHEFKTGTVAIAQLTGAPLVPVNWAASSAWRFNSWDRFALPKPFARIVIAVGEPRKIPKGTPTADLEKIAGEFGERITALEAVANAHLIGPGATGGWPKEGESR